MTGGANPGSAGRSSSGAAYGPLYLGPGPRMSREKPPERPSLAIVELWREGAVTTLRKNGTLSPAEQGELLEQLRQVLLDAWQIGKLTDAAVELLASVSGNNERRGKSLTVKVPRWAWRRLANVVEDVRPGHLQKQREGMNRQDEWLRARVAEGWTPQDIDDEINERPL